MSFCSPPELQKITVIVKLSSGVSDYEIRGVKDTDYKIWACYLAKKVTTLSNRVIAAYFQINPTYMETRLEEYSVGFLFYDNVKHEMDLMIQAYRDLENIRESA